jgi:hypothetical protein
LPGKHPALDVRCIVGSAAQGIRRDTRSLSRMANHKNNPTGWEFILPGLQFTEGDVVRPWSVARLPLVRLAHIK